MSFKSAVHFDKISSLISIFLSNSCRGGDEAFPVKFLQLNTAILHFIQILTKDELKLGG